MNYHKRVAEKTIKQVTESFPALLMTGARQVGKTTLLKEVAEAGRNYVTLDDLSLRALAKDDPKLFLKQFKPPLIIDEFQYAPELLPYLKIEIDNKPQKGLYWLTGSQHFRIMRNVSESLAGRVAVINLTGLSQKEIKQDLSETNPFLPHENYLNKKGYDSPQEIYRRIFRGSMPIPALTELDTEIFFNSYLQTYLLRDLRELTEIKNLSKFTRFIRVCAARTAQLLNYSDLASDADISVQTAKNWIGLLEGSDLIYLLQPYFGNITKRLIKTPKLYFSDTGFCAFLTGWKSPDTLMNGAMRGAIFETYAINEIKKTWINKGKQAPVYYLRNKDKKEIDLIIESDNRLFPIEIKVAAGIKKDWIKTFSVLKNESSRIKTGAVISQAEPNQYIDENNLAIHISHI